MGWNRKEGRRNEDFKKGRQAGSRGGCLKKGGGGAGTPLRTMLGEVPCLKRVIDYFCKLRNKTIAFVFQNVDWNRSIKVTFIAVQAYNYLSELFS